MGWEVEYTGEFNEWWNDLTVDEQEKIAVAAGRLAAAGPALDFPYSSGVNSRKYPHMRELRVQSSWKPVPRTVCV